MWVIVDNSLRRIPRRKALRRSALSHGDAADPVAHLAADWPFGNPLANPNFASGLTGWTVSLDVRTGTPSSPSFDGTPYLVAGNVEVGNATCHTRFAGIPMQTTKAQRATSIHPRSEITATRARRPTRPSRILPIFSASTRSDQRTRFTSTGATTTRLIQSCRRGAATWATPSWFRPIPGMLSCETTSSGSLSLPFDFPFYGQTYGDVSVSSNGLLQFGSWSYVSDASSSKGLKTVSATVLEMRGPSDRGLALMRYANEFLSSFVPACTRPPELAGGVHSEPPSRDLLFRATTCRDSVRGSQPAYPRVRREFLMSLPECLKNCPIIGISLIGKRLGASFLGKWPTQPQSARSLG